MNSTAQYILVSPDQVELTLDALYVASTLVSVVLFGVICVVGSMGVTATVQLLHNKCAPQYIDAHECDAV